MCCGQFPSLRVMNSSTAQLQKEKGQSLPTSQAAFGQAPGVFERVPIGPDAMLAY